MRYLLPLLIVPLLASSSAPPLKPVRWTLADGKGPRTVASGRTVDVTLEAEIDKGWYIYSLTQKPGGPFPLRIQLVGAADVGVRGTIRAPKPVTKFDPNFGIETELHRGKPKFTLSVGVPAGSLTGKREVQITARYQACSETLCLPPRTEKLPLTLRITSTR
jgi:thiol:disulfide interchange protein DsbD